VDAISISLFFLEAKSWQTKTKELQICSMNCKSKTEMNQIQEIEKTQLQQLLVMLIN
jgi:hypothetical protein